jgi:signal transduction histidine kinase
MPDDPIQRAIDLERARVLFTLDPVTFLTHWFSIIVFARLYWVDTPDRPLFVAWLLFYGGANCACIALWIWHARSPQRLAPRDWTTLHAVCGVFAAAASGLSIWFALTSPRADMPFLHGVLLMVIAVVLMMSNGFDTLNSSSTLPLVLVPTVLLHLHVPGGGWTRLALVFGFIFVALNIYVFGYRRIFRHIVKARVEQQDLATMLALQKQTSEQASAARTQFFAAASRDLRQPLHAIGLLAETLTDVETTSRQRARVAGHIGQRVEALNELFDQLLDLAQIESAGTPVTRVHFRLAELLAHIDHLYRPMAVAKGLAMHVAPTREVVYDDPVLIERVLRNLVSNAVKYTEAGAIWIGFRRAGQRTGGYIEVRDSGVGFGPSEKKRLCGQFQPSAQQGSDEPHRQGLGLATVRRLVGLLGGELKMRSAPGRGTTFRLPVRAGDPSLALPCVVGAGDAVVVRRMDVKRKILWIGVDDHEVIPAECASQLGWMLQRAPDAARALQMIEQGSAFDAVLYDYEPVAPHMDPEALVALRHALERPGGGRAVMMLLSTSDAAAPGIDTKALHGIPVLHWPVTPMRLVRTLNTLWQRRDWHDDGPMATASLAAEAVLSGANPQV